jgi:hypothetical protein
MKFTSHLFFFTLIFSQIIWGETVWCESLKVPVSPLMADRYVSGIPGKTGIILEPGKGQVLSQVAVGGRKISSREDFPSFIVLDQRGEHHTVDAADSRWTLKVRFDKTDTFVLYKAKGLEVEIGYGPGKDTVNIVVRVLSEGEWKLISVGGTILSKKVDRNSKEDYLIDGCGWLTYPKLVRALERKWDANSDNLIGGVTAAGFVGWREEDRVIIVKPLTFSYWLGWKAIPLAGETHFDLRAGLYFRPAETKIPQTKLCHKDLALRIETAGDANQDGKINWVDAGITYRERYIKSHPVDCFRHRLRDGFRVYYQMGATDDYQKAIQKLSSIDFAQGIWWYKGIMAPAVKGDSESHPFTVNLNPIYGNFESFKKTIASFGQWAGIYYGHDYICLDRGDWPEEFIKRNPDNQPYRYFTPSAGSTYRPKYYKDNVRSVATGLVFKHYDKILNVCSLKPGDPIMLDTFTAFARPGYHPDYPSTAELETQAKRRIAKYLHDDRRMIVAGEGLIEGTQDRVDYGAYSANPIQIIKDRNWELRDGIQHVPLFPVIFQGSGYYGAGWYEFRNSKPNWALGLVYGVGYWDWLPQGLDYAWTRLARYYFHQELPWSLVADAKVRDLHQEGSVFVITYSNGISLWADLDTNSWRLTRNGFTYDGFTPFNNRGYMAIIKPGKFEITIPGEHRLEISPNQPNKENIIFECISKNGNTFLRGHFGNQKWKNVRFRKNPDGSKGSELYEVEPVLVLREVK